MDKTSCQHTQITDVGCVRELNEDSLYSSQNLWIVADGMGGHACGEVASQIAVEVISTDFAQNGALDQAVQRAHEAIIRAGSMDSGQTGMGTTVVAVYSKENAYEVAWVGDSRVYLWDKLKNQLKQITEDHSLVVRLVKSGLLSEAEAKTHPQRHMITQCLGSVEIKKLQVDVIREQWKPGQQLLLCSDGLSDDVSEDSIAEILRQQNSNKEKCENLVEAAKQAGGKDNISIILIDSPVSTNTGFWTKMKSLLNN